MRVGDGASSRRERRVIASRNGSAIAVPIPCSIARRESRFLDSLLPPSAPLSHLKRSALDDTHDQLENR